jgi:uncharacterized protein (TIGR02145 family)
MKGNNIILTCTFITAVFVIMLISSCKKDSDKTVPILTTSAVSNITSVSAACGGNITGGCSSVIERGVCWSTGTTPTIADSKTVDGMGTGSFTSAITGLIPNTTYNVRAYATNDLGTGYGSVVSFTTPIVIVPDIDGNIYHTVTIGTQVWMVENLKTTKYRNGEPISNISDSLQWITLSTGAYCNYNNDANNSTTYGRLYNWYAVNDNRNIAPAGWHVATDAEWTTLINCLGGTGVAGGKMKEADTTHWSSPNIGANNSSGFTALPGGYRYNNGAFNNIRFNAYWWSATENDASTAWIRHLGKDHADADRASLYKVDGYSVRCLKD